MARPETVDGLVEALGARAYLADRGLATVLHVALALGRPVLLEGETGVGKTEVAKALADVLGARLIRLQCYEGIDVAHALYDWDYARQMLYIRALESAQRENQAIDAVFSPRFLLRRPLLDAVDNADRVAPVLLIDEIDRADEEFEAFLLELLSDFQVTIPEIGTVRARARPAIILTSNRTRELHDALRRRCLYHWIDHPDAERELEIVRVRAPGVPERLAAQAVAAVQRLRGLELAKVPGVAETIDWAESIAVLGAQELELETAAGVLGAVLKDPDDFRLLRELGVGELLADARARAPARIP